MDILRLNDETEKLVMALHKAVTLNCPLVVESELDKIKLDEFRIGMINCVNCKLIREDCKRIKIYTYSEFRDAVASGKINNLSNLVINNIQKFIEDFIGYRLKNLFVTSN